MPTALQNPPDWFDQFWSAHEKEIPIYLRGQKKLARELLGSFVEALGEYAKTPDGVEKVIAFGKIAAIAHGIGGVIESNPSPNQVVQFVEKLVQRVKP